MHASDSRQSIGWTTIVLCMAVAILEGLDLQSAGVAGPRLAREFQLSVQQMGFAFSAGAMGLLPGSAIGGRLADRFGRKGVLIGSVLMFGVFSWATTRAWNFESLMAMRILTGLGLGAATPNLIALCAEAAGAQRRGTAVGAMYAGMPLGGAIAAVVGIVFSGDAQWRAVFYFGGYGPILIALALFFAMDESAEFKAARRRLQSDAKPGFVEALWRHDRALITLTLWISYIGTLIVLYFLMNWLPSMMVSRGLTRAQGGLVLILFNLGASFGAVGMASLMDRTARRTVIVLMYAGNVAALCVLAAAVGVKTMMVGGFLCGVFSVGGQSVLYALAGQVYPAAVRGTGVGAAVAVGRLGAILGPLLGGALFAFGSSPSMLVFASIPVVLVAAAAALFVVAKSQPEGQDAALASQLS
ncbi:MAG TPA: 3-(3-hydroxy-phenyl)propionate transporter MhpT [Paraburkholderia sp.]|jgi:AAHS family 3-hydroxyphenylpropionic acid transporter|nr:3-(3-hydroxy-phenyl)propionate transporter MhpT [Paraburkholderia sp.]